MGESIFAALPSRWFSTGVPAIALSAAALALLIRGLAASLRRAHLFRAPLAERQEVEFAGAGRVVLSVEGPRFTKRFAGVQFDLRGSNGERIPSRPVRLRARISGLSRARTELLAYDIPKPGRYILIMSGQGNARETDAGHAVVFTRPHLNRTVAYIMGIVLASWIFVVSLVLVVLRLIEPGR